MDDETKSIAEEAIQHAKIATELFRESCAVHQEEQQRKITHRVAAERTLELNGRAIDESEVAIKLIKDFADRTEKEIREIRNDGQCRRLAFWQWSL